MNHGRQANDGEVRPINSHLERQQIRLRSGSTVLKDRRRKSYVWKYFRCCYEMKIEQSFFKQWNYRLDNQKYIETKSSRNTKSDLRNTNRLNTGG